MLENLNTLRYLPLGTAHEQVAYIFERNIACSVAVVRTLTQRLWIEYLSIAIT